MRYGQPDIACILHFAERSPLNVFDGIKHLGQIARSSQSGETLKGKERGAGRSHERCMGYCGNRGNVLQTRHVLGLWPELVVADQCSEGLSAKGSQLVFVHSFEEGTL